MHESSVSFVAVLLGLRALKKGFDTALYFFGIGALNCLETRGFPTIGDEIRKVRPAVIMSRDVTACWRCGS